MGFESCGGWNLSIPSFSGWQNKSQSFDKAIEFVGSWTLMIVRHMAVVEAPRDSSGAPKAAGRQSR
jgi:hypothetical protein